MSLTECCRPIRRTQTVGAWVVPWVADSMGHWGLTAYVSAWVSAGYRTQQEGSTSRWGPAPGIRWVGAAVVGRRSLEAAWAD